MRCVKINGNTGESRAQSTGMCMPDRPVMNPADVTQGHKLQRSVEKSPILSVAEVSHADAVGMINPRFREVQPKSLISNVSCSNLLDTDA